MPDTAAMQSTIGNRQSEIELSTLRGLHAEWREFSRNHGGPEGLTERDWRLYWTNGRLAARRQRSVTSWSELTQGQAKYLRRLLQEENGSGPAYRAAKIGRMAAELWGADWNKFLSIRLGERFRVGSPEDLSPRDARAMMEELESRIARRDGVEIEEVRKRFKNRAIGSSGHRAIERPDDAQDGAVAAQEGGVLARSGAEAGDCPGRGEPGAQADLQT
jgi:hypothetical protein